MRCIVTVVLVCLAASPAVKWSRVGDFAQVTVESGSQIHLNVSKASVAGAVTDSFPITGDTLIVHAEVSNAPARGMTVSVQDAAAGDSIGYWQNPISIDSMQSVDVAIPLSTQTSAGRLFVGSDGVESAAAVSNISWKPSSKSSFAQRSAYGTLVDTAHVAGQTFVATHAHLDAVVIRLRQLNDIDGPALRVRLYAWKDDAAVRDRVLAEKIVSRQLIPQPKQHEPIDLCIGLRADIAKAAAYYIEFSCVDTCTAEQAYLLYAGEDSYAHGSRYENASANQKWDLYFATFESD